MCYIKFLKDYQYKQSKTITMNNNQMQSANHIIEYLKEIDVDVETMEYIIKEVGMEAQILKQLIIMASDIDINNCIQERDHLISNDCIKDFWRNVRNSETK